MPVNVRPSAVAGSWYPGDRDRLAEAVDGYLEEAGTGVISRRAQVVALIAPHAGLMYSGPVAAHAYAYLRGRAFDVAVLIGPSHYLAFDGVAIWPHGAFATPFGRVAVEEALAARLVAECPVVHDNPTAHLREHSLELQLPFLARLQPDLPIVPLVMGRQDRPTALTLGDAVASVLEGRRALLIASSDLSHYQDAATASLLDGRVIDCVDAFDEEGLMSLLESRPDHACGGGPMVAVMRAARRLGARRAHVLRYADSGDVSGDKHSVVGYMAAAFTHD